MGPERETVVSKKVPYAIGKSATHLRTLPPSMPRLLTQRTRPLLTPRAQRHVSYDILRRNKDRARRDMAIRSIRRPELLRLGIEAFGPSIAEQRLRRSKVNITRCAAAWREERLVVHGVLEECGEVIAAHAVAAGDEDGVTDCGWVGADDTVGHSFSSCVCMVVFFS